MREKEGEREGAEAACRGGGYTPLAGAPCGGTAGMQESWREGISRRPHDLLRPGGTCAITLPKLQKPGVVVVGEVGGADLLQRENKMMSSYRCE